MKIQRFTTVLSSALALSLFFVSGCSKSEAPPTATAPSSPAPSTQAPSAPAEVSADAGTITGKVSFSGGAPSMKVVSMAKEASCAAAHKASPQKEETVVVNPNKTLRYVVVYLKSGVTGTPAAPGAPVMLDQKTCWYNPHVLAVMAGQPINVTNSDSGVLHNIHFMPKQNTPQNFGQPGPAPGAPPPSRTVSFSKPEMIPVKCDVHAWMHAYVAVLPNPYSAVTDESGSFTIKNVPPGKYTVEAWHEKYGTQDASVTVGKKETKTVSFSFK